MTDPTDMLGQQAGAACAAGIGRELVFGKTIRSDIINLV
jgi:hypothetical protein